QLAINEQVIAELDRGVVVFNRKGGIKGMNPKAREILGIGRGMSFEAVDKATLAALRALIAGERLVSDLDMGADGARRIKIRARVLTGNGSAQVASPDAARRRADSGDLAALDPSFE